MDFDLRLKALTGLVNSQSREAHDALEQVLKNAQTSLRLDTQYNLLYESLSIFEVIGHRFSDEVTAEIILFIESIKTRNITHTNELTVFTSNIAKYQNTFSLIVRAIEVLLRLRYLATERITPVLLKLSIDEDKDIRNKAIDGLKSIAAFDLDVFYGPDRQGGIGSLPQKQVLDLLLGLGDAEILDYQNAVLKIAESLLSPTIEGTRWSSKTLTISRGATPSNEGVFDIRCDTIRLLKRLYVQVKEISHKLSVISVLDSATRPHQMPSGDNDLTEMITRNSHDVLDFYGSLISTAEFPIVQKIESISYWIYYHSPNEQVRFYALAIEKKIAGNAEYQIYKTLVGFEGIFQGWDQLRKDDSYWEETDTWRKEKATEFASSITTDNFPIWRDRIFAYAKTESDDLATFPVFYHFLESFAKAQPKLALNLISEDSDKVARFLIPLLRGLWSGSEQFALREIINQWIAEGRYLYASTKQFLDCPSLDREVTKRLLKRAAELDDINTVSLVMAVATSNYSDDNSIIDDLFIPALKELTARESSQWIFDLWYRREAREIISKLDGQNTDLVLSNLMALEKIDYHAEEILYLIAQRMPQKVLEFLCLRLTSEATWEKKHKNYEAIPYTLHKLNKPIAEIPKEAIRIVRAQYIGESGMLIYRGAYLLKLIFPQFSPEFESELLSLVDDGGDKNIEFVLAILRNYDGQPFIHNICKSIVMKVPTDSQFRSDVYIALQNTGVVSGEYGFADAYERKKAEMQIWLNDPNDKIRQFAAWYIDGLDQMIVADRRRADEEIALRKHRYDE